MRRRRPLAFGLGKTSRSLARSREERLTPRETWADFRHWTPSTFQTLNAPISLCSSVGPLQARPPTASVDAEAYQRGAGFCLFLARLEAEHGRRSRRRAGDVDPAAQAWFWAYAVWVQLGEVAYCSHVHVHSIHMHDTAYRPPCQSVDEASQNTVPVPGSTSALVRGACESRRRVRNARWYR